RPTVAVFPTRHRVHLYAQAFSQLFLRYSKLLTALLQFFRCHWSPLFLAFFGARRRQIWPGEEKPNSPAPAFRNSTYRPPSNLAQFGLRALLRYLAQLLFAFLVIFFAGFVDLRPGFFAPLRSSSILICLSVRACASANASSASTTLSKRPLT